MAYPGKPAISTSYTAVAQSLGDGTFPGVQLDVDLAAIKASIDAIVEFLKLALRSDALITNASVTTDGLAPEITIGLNPPAPWAGTTSYAENDTVTHGTTFYRCTAAHTSTNDFATDSGAGKWAALIDLSVVADTLYDQFRTAYLGPFSSAPTLDNQGNALQTGALYFDTTATEMRVRTGAGAWVAALSPSATRSVYSTVASGGQTVFNTGLTLTAGLWDAFKNGNRLVVGDTVTGSGSTITLSSGAAGGDKIDVVVYQSYLLGSISSNQIVNALATNTDKTNVRAALGTMQNANYGAASIDAAKLDATLNMRLPKAWGVFAGSDGAIKSSYNIASVTRTGTGAYTVTFTNAMADAEYALMVTLQSAASDGVGAKFQGDPVLGSGNASAKTTGGFKLSCWSTVAAGVADPYRVFFVIFGN